MRFVEAGDALSGGQVICNRVSKTGPKSSRIEGTCDLCCPIVVRGTAGIEGSRFLERGVQQPVQLRREPVLHVDGRVSLPLTPLGASVLEPDLSHRSEGERG